MIHYAIVFLLSITRCTSFAIDVIDTDNIKWHRILFFLFDFDLQKFGTLALTISQLTLKWTMCVLSQSDDICHKD